MVEKERMDEMTNRRVALKWCASVAVAMMGGGQMKNAEGSEGVKILVMGDSLSAEYGIARGAGWVALAGKRFGGKVEMINASISGETTAGGKSRMSAELKKTMPQLVVIELGCNDALRGMTLDVMSKNLKEMVEAVKASGAKALLVGMKLPPNYGAKYGSEFEEAFKKVAAQTKSRLVPFMFEGLMNPKDAAKYFQEDGLHPRAAAQEVIMNNIMPELAASLEDLGVGKEGGKSKIKKEKTWK